jgi:hypothetical protein
MGTIRLTLENLKKCTNIIINSQDALENVRQWVKNSKLDKRKIVYAECVLDKIASNTETLTLISSVNMTEMEILCLICNRINDNVNRENRDTMIENLTEELADSQDQYGNLYCTIGRISRMLNSLNVLDPEVCIKPRWAMRQEMLQDASNLKNELLQILPTKIQNRLEEDMQFSDKFDEWFRNLLRNRYRQTYVDTMLMTQKQLDNEVNEWIDYV